MKPRWLKIPIDQGGIAGVAYPLLADSNRILANSCDVIGPEQGVLRGLFIIDKRGIVRHQSINERSIGRGIDETIRLLDAIQYFDTHGESCPANWTPGKDSPTSKITSILKKPPDSGKIH